MALMDWGNEWGSNWGGGVLGDNWTRYIDATMIRTLIPIAQRQIKTDMDLRTPGIIPAWNIVVIP